MEPLLLARLPLTAGRKRVQRVAGRCARPGTEARQDPGPSKAARAARTGQAESAGGGRGRGWRPGEVAAASPSRCCCCRRGGGWGTLCAMGVMAAVGYMAAETGADTRRRRGVRPGRGPAGRGHGGGRGQGQGERGAGQGRDQDHRERWAGP